MPTNAGASELLGPTGVSLPVGRTPTDVVVADFDRDGAPDLAAVNRDEGTVSVFLGDGGRGFSDMPSVAVGGSPVSLVAADLDGDGVPDLVTANSGDNSLSVVRGRGDGTFDAALGVPNVAAAPVDIAAADLNADGVPDLAVVARDSNSVSILLGTGAGQFGPPTSVGGLDQFPLSIATADFDKNGALDFAVANVQGGTVSVLLGDGAGGFSAPASFVVGANPASVLSGDFNLDGAPDMATLNIGDGQVSVLLGRGDGNFDLQVPDIEVGLSPIAGAAGDLDADGAEDLVVMNQDGNTLSILLGDGQGGFVRRCRSTQGGGCIEAPASSPRSAALGDFNRDGALDLVIANDTRDTATVHFGDGLGGFVGAPEVAVGRAPQAVVARDFNGDGSADLAVANTNDGSVSLLLGDRIGGFSAGRDLSEVFEGPVALAAGDFDHDQNADLAVANFNASASHVSILLGDGTGSFRRAQDVTLPRNRPGSLVAGDLDGDGHLDLVVVHETVRLLQGNRASILLGRGDGSFVVHGTLTILDDAGTAGTGDWDGDGDLDLAIANLADQSVRIFLGQGNGDFVQGIPDIRLGDGPTSLAVHDFDGDGRLDLAITLSGGGSVATFLGVGDGTFVRQADLDVGAGPDDVAVGDFNADGRPDLAVCHSLSHSLGILLGLGAGQFARIVDLTTGQEPKSLAVADFNDDGAPDLAVAARLDDSIMTLSNQLAGRADLNGSNRIDGFDVALIGRLMGTTSGDPGYRRSADVDLDGVIDGADLSLAAGRFGALIREASPLRASLTNAIPSGPDRVSLQQAAVEGDRLRVRVLVDDSDDPAGAADFTVTFGPDDSAAGQVLELIGFDAGSYLAGGVAQFIGLNARTPGRAGISALRFPPRDLVGAGPQPLLDLIFRARRAGTARLAFEPFGRATPALLYVDGCPDPTGCEVAGVSFDPGSVSVQVDASAGGPPGLKIGFSPSALDFGRVPFGTMARRTLRLSNFGFSELHVSAVTSTAPEFTTFMGCGAAGAAPSCVAVPIPAFGFVELPVQFAPSAAGDVTGQLTVESDDPHRPLVAIPVRGSAEQ